jgi:hypothetical protein
MKPLFSLKDCSDNEPSDPGPASTAEEIKDYNDAWGAWANSCIAGISKIPPGVPPIINVEQPRFEDKKGYTWIRTHSSNGIEFTLDLFDSPLKLKSLSVNSPDSVLVIAIRISLRGDYSVLTLSHGGISVKKLNRKKIRFASLSQAITNHEKFRLDFWNEQKTPSC